MEVKTITDESVLERLEQRLEQVEKYSLLAAKNVLTINDAALLTGLSVSHLYKLTSARKVPFFKPNPKLLYFKRKELEEWMMQNRVSTKAETEQAAVNYCVANRKGGAA